jgi:predicted lactoylglutathione lyase
MTQNYITVGTNNHDSAKQFYALVLPELGAKLTHDYSPHTVCYQMPDNFNIWIGKTQNGEPASFGNGVTIGLATDSEAKVDAAHAAAIAAGGKNEGDPGPRPMYGPEFYGGYVRDLDGNKLAFVHFRAAFNQH